MTDAEKQTHKSGAIHYSDALSLLSQTVTGSASEAAAAQLTDWMNGQGQADLQLSTRCTLSQWEISTRLLYPVLEHDGWMIFAQGGYYHPDDAHQANAGTGVRLFQDTWMSGINLFFDHDFSRSHSRFGSGIEYARDFISVSTNLYRRISGWRDDRYLADYQSRPASGWDIRTRGWLPAYPHLGGRLAVEQYYGSRVAMHGRQTFQHNPLAFTAGVNYTPFPLITASLDQKRGPGIWDTRFGMSLNYIPGTPWHLQISPDTVAQQRSLIGARYSFVDRHDEMVLEYRKQELIRLRFPPELRGVGQTVVSFAPVITSKYSIKRLELDEAELVRAGGGIVSVSPALVSVRLPFWRPDPVRLTGVAVDQRGNRSAMAVTQIYTTRAQHQLMLDADKQEARANGMDAVMFTARVSDPSGQPLAGVSVRFGTKIGQLSAEEGVTDTAGQFAVWLTSEQAGEAQVTARSGGQQVVHSGVRFTAAEQGEISVSKRTALASGEDKVGVTLTLKDARGKGVSGRDVNWSTSLGSLSVPLSKTDQNGQARVVLVSLTPGVGAVSASTTSGTWNSESITFRAMDVTVTSSVSQITSSGYDPALYTVTVRRADGTPLRGEQVRWESNLGTLSVLSAVTDGQGQASVLLTSRDTGVAKVVVTVGEEAHRAPDVTVVEYLRTFLTGSPMASINGRDSVIITLTVEDRDWQPLVGERVRWTTTRGTLSDNVTVTDKSGHTFVTVDSAEAGTAKVTADVRGNTQTHTINFGAAD
nr:inverse autotransporter beta domain-containing protein [Kluyvera intermedia]